MVLATGAHLLEAAQEGHTGPALLALEAGDLAGALREVDRVDNKLAGAAASPRCFAGPRATRSARPGPAPQPAGPRLSLPA